MARAAGSLRAALLALLAGVVCVHAALAQERLPDRLLAPNTILVGGFPADARLGGGYLKLVQPSALAAFADTLYIADPGLGQLLQIHVPSQRVTPMLPIPRAGAVRLHVAADGSLFVVLPDRAEVLRIGFGGHGTVRYADQGVITRPLDVAVETADQRIWVLDSTGELFEFHPLGRLAGPIGDDEGRIMPSLLAAGRDRVFALDNTCQCIIRLDQQGRPVLPFAHGAVRMPAAAAVDRFGRLWVADRADGALKVFADEQLVAKIPAIALGMTQISAIAFAQELAYVADGPGGKVMVFTLLPPEASK